MASEGGAVYEGSLPGSPVDDVVLASSVPAGDGKETADVVNPRDGKPSDPSDGDAFGPRESTQTTQTVDTQDPVITANTNKSTKSAGRASGRGSGRVSGRASITSSGSWISFGARGMSFRTRWIRMLTNDPETCPDDPNLQGVILQELPEAKPPDQRSSWQKIIGITKQFPLHFLMETMYLFLPLFGNVTQTLLHAIMIPLWADRAPPDFEGSMRDMGDGQTDVAFRLITNLTPAFFGQAGTFGYLVCVPCVLWKFEPLRQIATRRVPFFCLASMAGCALYYVTMKPIFYFSANIFMAINMYWCFFRAALVVKCRACKALFFPNVAGLLMFVFMRSFFERILSGSDAGKAIFVAVINPLICESLLIIPSRFIARSLRHNHPSTSFVCAIAQVLFKQLFGRTIVCMISNNLVVLLLSIANGTTEFCMRASLKKRDKLIYEQILGKFLPPELPATAALKHRRSALFRAHMAMLETLGEFIAIWNGAIMIILWDVSVDGKSAVNVAAVMQNIFVQSAAELLTDYLSCVAIKLDGIAVMDLAHGRKFMWSAPIGLGAVVGSSAACLSLLARAFCHSVRFTAATLIVCLSLDSLDDDSGARRLTHS
jgi:hypothetical protein